MKRKLIGIIVMLSLSLGYCTPACERWGGNCQLDNQQQGIVVMVNNQPRLIPNK